MHDLLQPTEIALRPSSSSSVAHVYARLKSLGQQSRSPSLCWIFTRRLLSRDRDRRRNWPRTERRQKVSDAKSKKSVRSALQNTVGRVSRSRHLFLFGLTRTFERVLCECALCDYAYVCMCVCVCVCECVCVCQRKTEDRADGMWEKMCPFPSTGFEPECLG